MFGSMRRHGQIGIGMVRRAVPGIIERGAAGDDVAAEIVVAHVELDLLDAALGQERADRVHERMIALRAQAGGDADQRVLADAHVVEAVGIAVPEILEHVDADIAEDDDDVLVLRRQLRHRGS